MKEIIKNSLILCLITLVAGLLLGGVYEFTKDARAEQEEKTKQKAYKKVLSEAADFQNVDFDETAMKNYLSENGTKSSVAYIDNVVVAKDGSGKELGYVITVVDKEGYGGDIKFTLGIDVEGTIKGISFLSISETAGVGMKATEGKFKNQFVGKKVESIVYVKDGAKEENQIDAISGATVTTNAVTNGVNAGLLGFRFITGEGGKSNE